MWTNVDQVRWQIWSQLYIARSLKRSYIWCHNDICRIRLWAIRLWSHKRHVRACYGVSLVSILENIDRVIKKLDCIYVIKPRSVALLLLSSIHLMTSSNGNIFRVTGHLCGEFTGARHKGQRRGTLMFSLICAWINGWVNNVKVGDLRRYRTHYDVTVMLNQGRLHYCFFPTFRIPLFSPDRDVMSYRAIFSRHLRSISRTHDICLLIKHYISRLASGNRWSCSYHEVYILSFWENLESSCQFSGVYQYVYNRDESASMLFLKLSCARN